jgi:hypothetical protein
MRAMILEVPGEPLETLRSGRVRGAAVLIIDPS